MSTFVEVEIPGPESHGGGGWEVGLGETYHGRVYGGEQMAYMAYARVECSGANQGAEEV